MPSARQRHAHSLSPAQLALFDFTEDDWTTLAGMHVRLAPEIPQVVSTFYDTLLASEPFVSALTGVDRVTIEAALVQYIGEVLNGEWTDAHVAGRGAIGLATGEQALEHIWFFGCSQLLRRLLADALALSADSAGALAAEIRTLDKALAIDLALASQAHREEYAEQLADRNELLEIQNNALKVQRDLRAQMVQMLIHDMSGPISTLITSTDVLQFSIDKAPERVDGLLDLMRRNQRRLRAMMHDVLDVYAAEDTSMQLDRGPVNLLAVVQDVMAEYDMLEVEEQPTFNLKVQKDLPPAWADANLLVRVLRNLLDNSAKYAPPDGHIAVCIDEEDGTEALRVTVADSGPGIPPADREHIFDKYFTNPNSDEPAARTKRRGLGLGLAFCRSVVESHGGRIWVEPPPNGEGAAFVFTVPVWDEPPI